MTEQMTDGDDDLVRLWQETSLGLPVQENLSARLARMTLAKFEHQSLIEDAFEWAGLLFIVIGVGPYWMATGDWIAPAVALAGGLFVVGYLWLQGRRRTRLDPAADARTYHVALLDRIDGRIRRHRTSQYWWFLPVWGPMMWMFVAGYRRAGDDTVGGLALTALGMLLGTALSGWVWWYGQRSALRDLWAYRGAVEAVYTDTQ